MTQAAAAAAERPISEDLILLVDRARTLAIRSADDYTRAAEFLLAIKDLRGQVAQTFDKHIAAAYQAHRALCAEKQKAERDLVESETIVKNLIAEWDTAQEREAARQQLQRDEQLREQQQRVEADASAAEAEGDYTRADALREQLAEPPAPIVKQTPQVSGIALRETWHAEVFDFTALVKAAADHAPWIALLLPEMKALHAQARSLKSRMQIPGVRAVSSKDVAARRSPRVVVQD